MEIINPNEIGAKISTLVSESKKRFIAVSPYIGLKDWKKVLLNLERAQKRNVSIDFYYREIRDEDFHALRNIGVKLFKIPGLHTKLYFNDDEFVVTSMNLYEYSDLHSVDIGIHYKDPESYRKLFDYFQKYIGSKKSDQTVFSKDFQNSLSTLQDYLQSRYADVRFTLTQTYLFSKMAVPIFHLFIYEGLLTLKLHQKLPSEKDIDTYSNMLLNLKGHLAEIDPPSDGYQWYLWKIKLNQNSHFEIMELIDELRKVCDNPTQEIIN